MAEIRLTKGDVWVLSGERYHLDQVMGGGLLHLRSERTSSPLQLETDSGDLATPTVAWLKDRFAAGEAKRIDESPSLSGVSALGSQSAGDFDTIIQRDKRALLRQLVLTSLDRISQYSLSDAALRRTLQSIWEAKPRQFGDFAMPAPSTVRLWLKSRGSTGSRPLGEMAGRQGRTTRRPRLPRSILRRLDKAARKFWSCRPTSMSEAYDDMCSDLNKLNRRLITSRFRPVSTPAFETFRRRVRKLESYATVAAKYGVREADTRYKAIGRGLEAERPLLLGAMDHTQVDCHIVVHVDQWRHLGRPWLTVAIDVHSRCIVGWVLSFEPPSIYSVTECLKRANRPKSKSGGAFASEPSLADIFGKFDELVVDNGLELAGVSFESALTDVGTSIRWAPIAEPTFKAIVERFFRTLNDLLFKKLPGGSVPIKDLRLWGINPQKDAVLTLEQLEDFLTKAIATYHLTIHRTLKEQPLKVWNRGIATIGGVPVIGDDEQLDRMMGAEARRTLTRSGIRLFDLSYHDQAITGPLLEDLAASEPIRRRTIGSATAKVKVKYNPANIGCIHVWNPKRRRFETLPCTNPEVEGRSKWQHERMQEWHAETLALAKRQETEAKAKLNSAIAEATPQKESNRRKRTAARLASTPRVEPVRARLRSAVAEPRHDGMAPIINMATLAPERTDDHVKPIRPQRGKPKPKRLSKASPSDPSTTSAEWSVPDVDDDRWEPFQ